MPNTVVKQNWKYRMADPQRSVKSRGYSLHLGLEDLAEYIRRHVADPYSTSCPEPMWPEGEPEIWEASDRVIECLHAHARIGASVGLHFGCPIDRLHRVIGGNAWIKPLCPTN